MSAAERRVALLRRIEGMQPANDPHEPGTCPFCRTAGPRARLADGWWIVPAVALGILGWLGAAYALGWVGAW